MSKDGQEEDPEVILPVPDAEEPLSTPPKPGTEPMVMSNTELNIVYYNVP